MSNEFLDGYGERETLFAINIEGPNFLILGKIVKPCNKNRMTVLICFSPISGPQTLLFTEKCIEGKGLLRL
jgi:hypothetical protein